MRHADSGVLLARADAFQVEVVAAQITCSVTAHI